MPPADIMHQAFKQIGVGQNAARPNQNLGVGQNATLSTQNPLFNG